MCQRPAVATRATPRPYRCGLRGLAVGCALAISWHNPASGQEMPAPIGQQVTLLTKVLQFDRSFAERTGDEVVIAILYQSRFRASLTARDAVAEAFAAHQRIGDKLIRVVSIEIVPGQSPEGPLAASGATVAYITPLRSTGLLDILDVTRRLHILTSTGVPSYVTEGVSVGISVRADRPEILINLDASIEEGARFSSELLKLSSVLTAREDSHE